MAKQELLDNLKNQVFCRLDVSDIAGIGVRAIRPIPAGIDPFQAAGYSCQSDQVVQLTKEDLSELHPRVRKLVKDFFLQNPRLSMLVKSFDKMTMEKQTAHLQHAERYLEKLAQQNIG